MPRGNKRGPRGPYKKSKKRARGTAVAIPKQVAQSTFLIAEPGGAHKLVSGPNLTTEIKRVDGGSVVYKLEKVGVVKQTTTIE
jgi:hypothetical protein